MRCMSSGSAQIRGAVASRDAALDRVRKATVVLTGGCVGLAAAFVALAAGSTHARRTAPPLVLQASRRPRQIVVAPAPPLVAVAQTTDHAPQPPANAPAAAPPGAPPVAVSGGS
jgi:hypothetical protein